MTESAVQLHALSLEAMRALASGDVATASSVSGLTLTPYLAGEECAWLWRLRAEQISAEPTHARWVARAAIARRTGEVVGHAGFHGPPDEGGLVEIGYTVDPRFRRKGYGRALVRELLARAAAEPEVVTVRATISPGNTASLATIAGFGFERTGEQWDHEDGLETIFDVRVR